MDTRSLKFATIAVATDLSYASGAVADSHVFFRQDPSPTRSATLHSASNFSAPGAIDWRAGNACIRLSSMPSLRA
jgi:hypothetical protein